MDSLPQNTRKMHGEVNNVPKIEEYARVMEELHRKAYKEGKEYGFLFCEKEGKLFPSMTTEGGARAIEKIVDCKIFDAKEKGYFHTHPSEIGISLPAAEDVCYAIDRNHDFLCVSGEIPRRVACWQIEKEKTEQFKTECSKLKQAETAKEAMEISMAITNKMDKLLKEFYSKPIRNKNAKD